MEDIKKKEDLLKKFLDKKETCEGDECIVPEKGDLVEKMNKKFVTQDGRQLLREVINESN